VRDKRGILKWTGGAVFVAAAGMQFFNPACTNPSVAPGHDLLATNPPPQSIADGLKESCYDCHSYETRWPWYSHVAPVSWLVVGHVNDARDVLNFSEWPHDEPGRARKKWKRVADAVDSGDMPLRQYTWIHRGARLDAEQRRQLVDWAQKEAKRLASEQ
jgi:hypothetical protein